MVAPYKSLIVSAVAVALAMIAVSVEGYDAAVAVDSTNGAKRMLRLEATEVFEADMADDSECGSLEMAENDSECGSLEMAENDSECGSLEMAEDGSECGSLEMAENNNDSQSNTWNSGGSTNTGGGN
ncbi:hypothetical protein G195_010356, partial [Phytophthora kernoviae 00238/432]